MVTFGDELKRLRKGVGLKINQLAQKVGVSPEFITQVEKGRKFPSVLTLEKLAAQLGDDLRISYYNKHRPDILAVIKNQTFAKEIKRSKRRSSPHPKTKKPFFQAASDENLNQRSKLTE